jgi:hypothetical protein
MMRSIPGRMTFTTTFSPSGNTAEWTCATDAEASGWRSKLKKRSLIFLPRASSTILMKTSLSKGGTSSLKSTLVHYRYLGELSLVLVERSCPNFTNIGPRLSRARLSLSPLVFLALGNIFVNNSNILNL